MAKLRRLINSALVGGAFSLLVVAAASCLSRSRPTTEVLVYKGPVEVKIEPGKTLPATDILYVGVKDGSAEFRIEDKAAFKKVGDSLTWKGTPVDGLQLDFGLRILLITEQAVHAGGSVNMEVERPLPEAMALDTVSQAKFAVPVTYGVKHGDKIPGTLIEYQGQEEEKGAKLGGIEDYPYRRTGDSLVWEGKLRDGIFLKLDLRVLFFNADSLRVGGLATLWIEG